MDSIFLLGPETGNVVPKAASRATSWSTSLEVEGKLRGCGLRDPGAPVPPALEDGLFQFGFRRSSTAETRNLIQSGAWDDSSSGRFCVRLRNGLRS